MQKYDSFLAYKILQYDKSKIPHIIDNNGSLEELHQQIDAIFSKIKARKRRQEFRNGIKPICKKLGKIGTLERSGETSVMR